MEYRILGPLEVLDEGGQKLPLGGAMQQSVLASLLLRAGKTVALERLVEELWEDPPTTATRTVQAYVSRLRHELPGGAIESRPGGYAFALDGGELDLDTFARRAGEGHAALAAGECERAAGLLGGALALWRGPALAGLTSEGLRRQADRLEEQRLTVLEDRIDADLGAGRHAEVVAELNALVAEHPFRERLRGQLMRALYRSGRPSEALALYREGRQLLVEELGLEPGQELRELEQAILRQDAELSRSDGAAPSVVSGTVTFLFTDIEGSTQLLKSLGRARYAAVLAEHGSLLRAAFGEYHGEVIDTQGDAFFVAFRSAADAVSAAAAAQRSLQRHGWEEGASLSVRMGLHTGEAALTDDRYLGLAVHLAARIGSAAHGGQVLLSDLTRGLVEDELPPDVALHHLGERRLKDIERPVRLYQLEVAGLPTEFPPLRTGETAGDGREGKPLAEAGDVLRPRSRLRLALVAAAVGAVLLTAAMVLLTRGGSGVAVAANSVALIDPTTNKVVDDITGVGTKPGQIVSGEGAIWVASPSDDTVVRIDPQTRRIVKHVGLPFAPSYLAAGFGRIWVTGGGAGVLVAIDPNSNTRGIPIQLPPLSPGATPSADGVAVGSDGVWVYDTGQQEVFRINPQTSKPDRPFQPGTVGGDLPTPIAVDQDALWYLCCQHLGAQLGRLDLRAASPTLFPLGAGFPTSLARGGGSEWVTLTPDWLAKIDPTGKLTSKNELPGASNPVSVAVGGGAVWVANADSRNVSRVDPATDETIKTISLSGHPPAGVASGGRLVWVTVAS